MGLERQVPGIIKLYIYMTAGTSTAVRVIREMSIEDLDMPGYHCSLSCSYLQVVVCLLGWKDLHLHLLAILCVLWSSSDCLQANIHLLHSE